MNIQEEILNALAGDKKMAKLIIQKTRQTDIVRRRWEVWVILKTNGRSNTEIALHFNTTCANVYHGVERVLKTKGKILFRPIKACELTKLKKDTKGDKGKLYAALNDLGYTYSDISRRLGIHPSTVGYHSIKYRNAQDFENSRKKITKF